MMNYGLRVFILAVGFFKFVQGQEFTLLTWNILHAYAPDVESFEYSGSPASFKKGDFTRFIKNFKVAKRDLLGVSGIIEQINSDIVCLQEVGQQLFDSGAFDDFNQIYQRVSWVQKGQNSGVGIYLKKNSLFELKRHGGFLFGESLDSLESDKHSALAWAILTDKADNVLLVCSINFARDNDRSALAKGQNLWKTVFGMLQDVDDQVRIMANKKNKAIIFAGDFNTFYEEILHDTLRFLNGLVGNQTSFDMYRHLSWTANRNINFDFHAKIKPNFTDKGADNQFTFSSIDHVIYSNEALLLNEQASFVGDVHKSYQDADVLNAKVPMSRSNKFALIHKNVPSDHLPLLVTFSFQEPAGKGKAIAPVGFRDQGLNNNQYHNVMQALELANCLPSRR